MPVTRFVAPGPEVAQQTPALPRDARVGVGGVRGGLLVPHEHVLDVGVLLQRVVHRQVRAAGVAEDDLDSLLAETLHDDFRACELHYVLLGTKRPMPAALVIRGSPAPAGPS